MKLAITLFHYFPYGGLERDMLAVARICHARGHQVTIYTQGWEGLLPEDIAVQIIPVRSWSNHGRAQEFAQRFNQLRKQAAIDLVVGFNKMPGLDLYFAADTCFAQKVYEERSWIYRHSCRSRAYLALERGVFDVQNDCYVLMISHAQIPVFQRYYTTPGSRFHLLPPGINRARIMPKNYQSCRNTLRQKFALGENDFLMLMVGSDFHRKGVARAIKALASLPKELQARTYLWVAGKGEVTSFIDLAHKMGVKEQFAMLGTRDDVSELMWSADVFLHPAYSENTGTVLLESMVAGLPVIASDVCGYAHYINTWQMGKVLASDDIDAQLAAAITEIAAQDSDEWRARARRFIEQADIFDMHENIVTIIESMGSKPLERTGHSD